MSEGQRLAEMLNGYTKEYALEALSDKAYLNLISYEFTTEDVAEAVKIIASR